MFAYYNDLMSMIATSGRRSAPRLVTMLPLDVMFFPVATMPLDRGLVLMIALMVAVVFVKSHMVVDERCIRPEYDAKVQPILYDVNYSRNLALSVSYLLSSTRCF